MPGKTRIVETGKETSILLDADAGKVAVGGKDIEGRVEVSTDGRVVGLLRAKPAVAPDPHRPRADPGGGVLELSRPDGKPARVVLDAGGGTVRAPVFAATGSEGSVGVHVDGDEPAVVIGGEERGRLRIRDSAGHTSVSIDPSLMHLGTPARDRSADDPLLSGYCVYFYDNQGRDSVFVDGVAGRLLLGAPIEGRRKIELDSRNGRVTLGLPGASQDDRPVLLEGDEGVVSAGCRGTAGKVRVRDAESRLAIELDGATGALTLGAKGREGDLIVIDGDGREVLRVNGASASIRLGADGVGGDIAVTDDEGRQVCHIDGRTGAMRLGTNGNGGDFYITDDLGRQACHIDGPTAGMRLGTNGNGGAFVVQDGAGRDAVRLDGDLAQVGVGSSGHAGQIGVSNAAGTETIRLDGQSGDILLANADCAEEFDFATASVEPGSVVVIDTDEQLALSTQAYDTRVAGVVSGAGRYRPALVLDRRHDRARPAVAMFGKVECRVDARHGPIRSGDLLVSSPTPGHAMAANDRARTAGAVLGKALRGLERGQGLIPILVCLQ